MHCPYTGLRSFTEEESLYFKGRDLQADQITALLEQNKFLMITGASGEGKSSLIYAGLIPNARAGFFRARYTNWLIADFRPERKPLKNLAHSLATQLQSNEHSVETELKRGFSSLVDLYTNSAFYAGDDDEQQPDGNKERRRKAANLLILVDQFEEFFTNPENFQNEQPSAEAQTVVNLILETATIAIKRNLPIYVVCTMRSDYIGQCSAFRGLPEFIGFSQFFVPRLKRRDLKEVIEEPALLSGNRISQRLIERLVYDVAEGVDQLPILQHALSRIWQYANNGQEEMDLVHYAMVGGMPAEELPDEDKPRFYKWFNELSDRHRAFYKDPGLQKVVEIHANLLYENSWEYYSSHHPEQPITQRDAKRIIALCFSCLTRIDNSRAVRNRMSLEEITAIINSPHLTTTIVGHVLNIFREEGNSFIRPFITADRTSREISPDTVLDITHESLIRNWNKLIQWAEKEFEYYSTYLDFSQQLERWKRSGKSRGYLLPIGPLTYFENWYQEAKPNVGWINRYAGNRHETSAYKAEHELADAKQFLKASGRKVAITRAFMKYGPLRIALGLAILIMLGLSGYYLYDANLKKNDKVIQRLRTEAASLISSPEVNLADKAIYLIAQERYDSGTLIQDLRTRDYESRLKLAVESYKQAIYIDKLHPSYIKDSLVSLLSEMLIHPPSAASPELLLTEGNKFTVLLAMDGYYLPAGEKDSTLAAVCEKNYDLVNLFLTHREWYQPSVPVQLNLAIQFWLSKGNATAEKIKAVLQKFSPREGKDAAAAFGLYYSKGSYEANGRLSSDFSLGYHTLACLYAALGDAENRNWCFQEWLDNGQRDYFEAARVLNNHLNVIGYLYQFGHRDQVPAMLQWLSTHTNDNPPLTLLRNTVIRSGYISHLYTINIDRDYHRSTRGYLYPNLCLMSRANFDSLEADYEGEIRNMKDVNERNFQLAMNDKRKAMFYSKYFYDRHLPVDKGRLDGWLDEAMDLYSKIDQQWLEGTQSLTVIYNGDGVRTSDVKRKNLFIYPDYRDGWFSWTFHTDYFFNYLKSHGQLGNLYKTAADLQNIHYWAFKGFEWKPQMAPLTYSNDFRLPDSTLKSILQFVNQHPEGKSFDQNMIHLVLANRAFEAGDTSAAMLEYKKVNLDYLQSSSNRYEYLEKDFVINMMYRLATYLAGAGKLTDADQIVKRFETDRQKVQAYLGMSEKLYRREGNPLSFVALDSAFAIDRKIDYSYEMPDVDPRFYKIFVLSEIGSRTLSGQAGEVLRELPERTKGFGIISRVSGITYEGNYYNALTNIPATLTETQDLQCRGLILLQACQNRERISGDTHWKGMDEYLLWNFTGYLDFVPN